MGPLNQKFCHTPHEWNLWCPDYNCFKLQRSASSAVELAHARTCEKKWIFNCKISGSDSSPWNDRHWFIFQPTTIGLVLNNRRNLRQDNIEKKGERKRKYPIFSKKKKKKKKKKQVRAHTFWHGDPCAVTFVYSKTKTRFICHWKLIYGAKNAFISRFHGNNFVQDFFFQTHPSFWSFFYNRWPSIGYSGKSKNREFLSFLSLFH